MEKTLPDVVVETLVARVPEISAVCEIQLIQQSVQCRIPGLHMIVRCVVHIEGGLDTVQTVVMLQIQKRLRELTEPIYTGDSQYRYFHRLYDNKYWESVYSYESGIPVYPELTADTITRAYRGGTIVDLGVVRKDYRSDAGQWIVPSKLDYTRYLCICEKHNNNKTGMNNVVYKLKDGFKSRVMMSDKSFLVLNCSAVFERHPRRNYINPSWDNTECSTAWMMKNSIIYVRI